MAEVTGLRNNALPFPVYGVPYGVILPILDADGDPVSGATGLDSEISKNGDTFADCTNEATEIGSTGIYYLLLTAAEMTADVIAIQTKTTSSGAKTTVLTLYPRKLVTLRSGTIGANAADGSTCQLDSGAVAIDDYYNGCLLVGVLDGTTEARIITDYVGSTKVCSVAPNFNIAPDNNDTFTVYLPESRQVGQADPVGWLGTALATPDTAGYPKTTIKSGTGTGEIKLSSGYVAPNWADVGNPSTAVNLSATTVKTLTDAPSDSSGVTTLLSRLTALRAGYLDLLNTYLDAAITTRLASASYTAPDNTGIGDIKLKTDNLPSDPADQSLIIAATNALASAIAALNDYDGSDTAGVTTLLDRLTATRAGYLDALAGTVPARLKKNTAFPNFMFKMELTDGSPGTGLTVTVERSLDAAAFGALADPTVTEIGSGWYTCDLAAGDLNADAVAFKATATGAKQLDLLIITQAAT